MNIIDYIFVLKKQKRNNNGADTKAERRIVSI